MAPPEPQIGGPEPEIVAIAAPGGREGRAIEQMLRSADIACGLFDPVDLVAGITAAGIAAAVITEEALLGLRQAEIEGALQAQPPWSDIPMIVLTAKGQLAAASAALIPFLGHVTQIERPVNGVTLVRAVRAALRARARQYQAAGDLAERAGAEERLESRAKTLEQQVRERTRELTAVNGQLFAEMIQRIDAQDRMNQMQAQLIHVSRVSAMNAMASTIAHELNQPLTAVMNYALGSKRLLERQEPRAPPEVISALDATIASAHRAGEIVRHLRDLVRTDDADRKSHDLPRLIEESLAFGMIDAHALGVTYRLELDLAATPVVVDAVQVQQVLINLFRNAIEAMQSVPFREVTISSRRCDRDMVEVTVADTGPGLSDGAIASLFSPFSTTKSHGMGIGLSISRTIVEANGGTMSGQNRPGGGAMFRFTLRLNAGFEDTPPCEPG